MKICNKCLIEKTDGEFQKRAYEKGLQPYCKSCNKISFRRYYEKNSEYIGKRINGKKTKIRKWIADYKLDKRCERCEENAPECLEFHHLNPSEKSFTIGLAVTQNKKLSEIQEEIKKCIVLCKNCHAKLHFQEKLSKSAVGPAINQDP